MSSTPVQLRLDDDQLAWLRDEAASQDRTIAWVIGEAVTEYRKQRSVPGLSPAKTALLDRLMQKRPAGPAERRSQLNALRANRAQIVLRPYEEQLSAPDEAAIDLVTDVLHLMYLQAQASGDDDPVGTANSLLDMAQQHFLDETWPGGPEARQADIQALKGDAGHGAD